MIKNDWKEDLSIRLSHEFDCVAQESMSRLQKQVLGSKRRRNKKGWTELIYAAKKTAVPTRRRKVLSVCGSSVRVMVDSSHLRHITGRLTDMDVLIDCITGSLYGPDGHCLTGRLVIDDNPQGDG